MLESTSIGSAGLRTPAPRSESSWIGHVEHGDTFGPCGTPPPPPPVDADGDGYPAGSPEEGGDCDDSDAPIHPGGVDVAGDGIDQDCDGSDATASGPADADGDGYTVAVDCNDADPLISPLATDVPNDGIDQNCDGRDLVLGDGSVRVTLTWNGDDDLDLHVIDPLGTRVWWFDREPPGGGILDRDDNATPCGHDLEPGGVENVYWPLGTAPTGTYTVEIYAFEDCLPLNADWTLQIFIDGTLASTQSGTGGVGTRADPFGVPIGNTTFIYP